MGFIEVKTVSGQLIFVGVRYIKKVCPDTEKNQTCIFLNEYLVRDTDCVIVKECYEDVKNKILNATIQNCYVKMEG